MWDDSLRLLSEQAALAVGRLDGISALLPNTGIFLYACVRKEALVSSQIEGTQSSLSDLLLHELDGVPVDDVEEVSNYIAALDHGLKRLREGFPLPSRSRESRHLREPRGRRGARDPRRGSNRHSADSRRARAHEHRNRDARQANRVTNLGYNFVTGGVATTSVSAPGVAPLSSGQTFFDAATPAAGRVKSRTETGRATYYGYTARGELRAKWGPAIPCATAMTTRGGS